MSEQQTGGPAFPTKDQPYHSSDTKGMTLRDYFAAKAMQAIIQPARLKNNPDSAIAQSCYAMADAMLKARSA